MPREIRSAASAIASTAIQQAIARPSTVIATTLLSNSHGSSSDSTSVEMKAIINKLRILRGRSRPQRTRGPTPSSSANGTISQVNMVLKNGSPIEILPSPSCLCTSGSSVPSNTTSIAATSKTLFANSKDSRDHSALFTRERTLCPRAANSSSEPPITSTIKARINIPRAGSDANACTDTSTPERTRKVPSRHNEKALIASSNVHALKLARCSVTASECINAVPTSHGINEAFSTGSQNHQPPQPSS